MIYRVWFDVKLEHSEVDEVTAKAIERFKKLPKARREWARLADYREELNTRLALNDLFDDPILQAVDALDLEIGAVGCRELSKEEQNEEYREGIGGFFHPSAVLQLR